MLERFTGGKSHTPSLIIFRCYEPSAFFFLYFADNSGLRIPNNLSPYFLTCPLLVLLPRLGARQEPALDCRLTNFGSRRALKDRYFVNTLEKLSPIFCQRDTIDLT